MFPVCDTVPAPTRPLVTVALMTAGIAGFLLLGPPTGALVGGTSIGSSWLPSVLNAVLALVRPTDWLTLAATVAALWLFGPTVEDRLGRWRFALLYVGAGIAASVAAAASGSGRATEMGGPAAALAAIIAAHLSMYPQGRMLVVVPDRSGVDFVDVPSWLLAGFWLLAHLLSAELAMKHMSSWSLVTAAGHLATGAVLGGAFVHLLKRPERMRAEWWGRLHTRTPVPDSARMVASSRQDLR